MNRNYSEDDMVVMNWNHLYPELMKYYKDLTQDTKGKKLLGLAVDAMRDELNTVMSMLNQSTADLTALNRFMRAIKLLAALQNQDASIKRGQLVIREINS